MIKTPMEMKIKSIDVSFDYPGHLYESDADIVSCVGLHSGEHG